MLIEFKSFGLLCLYMLYILTDQGNKVFISPTIWSVDLSDSQHLIGSVTDLFNKIELASDACIVRKI